MRVLRYADLDCSGLQRPYEQTVALLAAGDFRGAEVKKLTGRPFYRAKLSASDRLLFRFGSYGGETVLILLEIIRNHAYDRSRFLRGATVDETQLLPVQQAAPLDPADVLPLAYVNPKHSHVRILDRVISFDDPQEAALQQRPPLILVGAAGSGKTVLTIEKLRQLPGDVLYVTRSPYLVDNARRLYFAEGYENEHQDVAFLSFLEFVHSIAIPEGKPQTFAEFAAWFARHRAASPVKDANALYEEFAGVLTGNDVSRPYLSLEEYLALGVRRSIFAPEERTAVHALFVRHLEALRASGRYELNLLCHAYHARCQPTYDFVVADEVQDLTAVQLSLILKSLRHAGQFVLCGDANQIVHPNFFSWSSIKSLLLAHPASGERDIARILSTNYRNAPEVTALANRLLLLKNARFGSVDRESHHLASSVATAGGTVSLLPDTDAVRRDLDARTGRSARVALLVLRDEDKADAARLFRTPLVFSVQEAKGLEYETVLLLNLVSGQSRNFADVAEGVTAEDLRGEFDYARVKDKSDKSLEAYKFFVNALYVAVTRAVRNLYLIERLPTHPLLTLLDVKPEGGAATLAAESSSEEEWKEEARRLDAQGKTEQAEAIRRTLVHTEPVPWDVVTRDTVDALTERVRGAIRPDPKAQQLLLDYAVTFSAPVPLAILQGLRFRPALSPDQALATARQRHAVDYHQRGYRDLLRKVQRHGVDFRDPLNRTPLMLATQLGMAPLARDLVAAGASLQACDNWGRIPLQLALREAYGNRFYAKTALGPIFDVVAPPALDAQVAGRFVRIDRHRMEFFLLHSMLALFEMVLRSKVKMSIPAFEAGDFLTSLEHFPDSVIPAHRRRREAISAALARNEVFRDGSGPNRRLFVRLRHGFYVPNPCMRLALGAEWFDVRDLVRLEALGEEPGGELRPLVRAITEAEKEILRVFAAEKNHEEAPADLAPQDAVESQAAPTPEVVAPPAATPPRAHATPTDRRRRPASPLPFGVEAMSKGMELLTQRGPEWEAIMALASARPLAPAPHEEWFIAHPEEAACMQLAVLGSTAAGTLGTVATTLIPIQCALRRAAHRDGRAFPRLLHLRSQPMAPKAFLECSADNLGRILASVATGPTDLAELENVVLDDSANPWLREGALHALAVRMLHDPDRDDRGRCIEVARALLTPPARRDRRHAPTSLLQRVMRTAALLHLHELSPDLLRADHEGWLPTGHDPLSNPRLVQRLDQPLEVALKASRMDTPGLVAHPQDETAHFACLRPLADRSQPTRPDRRAPPRSTAPQRPGDPGFGASETPWNPPSSGEAASDTEAPVGRNAPCPCGSGRKFKKCCGR